MKYRLERAGKIYEIDVQLTEDGCIVRGLDGEAQRISFEARADGSQRATTPWGECEIVSARRGSELWADVARRRLSARVERARPASAGSAGAARAGSLCSPMPGKLLRVDARVGERVVAGQALAVIEAMKMENELIAPITGVVTEVAQTAPATIEKGAIILVIEPQ